MKSQDVKKSNSEAIKNMMDLEGNLSTFHYFAISFNGFGGCKQTLRVLCSESPWHGDFKNNLGFHLASSVMATHTLFKYSVF